MRAIVLFTLLALVNIIVGCAYTDRRTRIEEQRSFPTKDISGVILSTTITGLVLKSGDTVSMQHGSASYNRESGTVSGTLEDGNPVSAALNDIESMSLARATIDGYDSLTVAPAEVFVRTRQKSGRNTSGYDLTEGRLVRFKKPGAVYDPNREIFRGVTEDDMLVEIEAQKVYSVMTKKLAPERLLTSAALLGAAGLLLVVYISLVATDKSLPE